MGGRLASVQTAVNHTIDSALAASFGVSVENISGAAINVFPPVGLAFENFAVNAPVALLPGSVLTAWNVGGQFVIEHLGPNYDPVIPDDGAGAAHVFFDGTGIRDLYGNAWAQNGSVPQVPAAYPLPPGVGPFSDANYYSLGAGADVLDFAGDFSVCVVLNPARAVNQGVISDAAAFGAAGAGWRLMITTGTVTFDTLAAGSVFTRCTDTVPATLSVLCFGRSGTNQRLKVNFQTLVTTAGAQNTPATGEPARIGRYAEPNIFGAHSIYEVWAAAVTPTDALFTAIALRVKQRLGITAW